MIEKMKKIILLITMLFITSGICLAQIIVTPYPTPTAISTLLQGSNTTVSNVAINCSPQAIALINATNSNLGIGDALFLSTGSVLDIASPNIATEISSNWGFPGDANLADLTAQPFTSSFDACIVEFDVVPAYNNINFQFIFASEDYLNPGSATYQDNCGVFVSGSGITGLKNLALVPGTATPVNAASINASTNATLFVDNTGGPTFRYDGFTTVLTGSVTAVPQSIYHFKVGIVDLGDANFDSGLIIGGSGFWSNNSSGIAEYDNSTLSIYPNPAKDRFTLQLETEFTNAQLQIFNTLGENIYSTQIVNSTSYIVHQDLPSGIYFVKVSEGEKMFTEKLIVQ
jgi:hypothetical protein